MNLLKPFRKKMRSLGIQSSTPLLLAVSGGLDSMVLLHLSANARYTIAVAHVNFELRGTESFVDQEFVKAECEKLGVPFFTENLSVDKSSDNVQVTARNLRYAWFNYLCKEHSFEYVLTAHHRDDRIETFFINLLRGSGIKGLRSIPERNQNRIRPILQFSKKQLQAYAEENGIAWREDASNKETDYLRNKIRHGIAKDYSELSEMADDNLAKSIDFITEANLYFNNAAAVFIKSLKVQNRLYFIPDERWIFLFVTKPLHKYVMEYFGFRADQLEALENFDESDVGKRIEGEKYTVYRDREQFVLEPINNEEPLEISINSIDGRIFEPIRLAWQTQKDFNESPANYPKFTFLNGDKIFFPLVLRKWKAGDKFMPLGMKGFKKLSDFLTDQKLSIPQKNNTYVLESNGEICWVVGLRIDERFKTIDNQEFTLILNFDQPD